MGGQLVPLRVGINANNLQFYGSGVIDANSCPPAGWGYKLNPADP